MASIHKLHSDILWSIFALNTSPPLTRTTNRNIEYGLRPLTVARQTSQVCSIWRQILLTSASLWGRLIDLNLLGQKNRIWADEVVRRTGSAVLWIVGDMRPEESAGANEDFSFSLLDNLERIQILEIEVHEGIDHNDPRWEALLRPAPNLQFFKFFHSQSLFQNSQRPVFANHAPSLLHFDTHQVPFSMDAPWLSNIRDIRFPLAFTVRQVLDLCCRTPRLEFLLPSDPPGQNKILIEPLPRIHLPFLTSIMLMMELGTCLTFLDHITSAPGCSLFLHTNDGTAASVTGRVLEAAPKILSRRVMNYFSYHASSRVRIEYMPAALSFLDVSYHSDGDRRFIIRLYSWDPYDPEVHALLNQAFVFPSASLACLFSIKELELFLYDILPSTYPGLRSVLEAFRSVNKIATSFYSISHLIDLEALSYRIIFPALQTLEISADGEDISEPIDMADLLPFLRRYQDGGRPLMLLKLTDYHEEELLNINDLNEIDGLMLRWKSGEEVIERACGCET